MHCQGPRRVVSENVSAVACISRSRTPGLIRSFTRRMPTLPVYIGTIHALLHSVYLGGRHHTPILYTNPALLFRVSSCIYSYSIAGTPPKVWRCKDSLFRRRMDVLMPVPTPRSCEKHRSTAVASAVSDRTAVPLRVYAAMVTFAAVCVGCRRRRAAVTGWCSAFCMRGEFRRLISCSFVMPRSRHGRTNVPASRCSPFIIYQPAVTYVCVFICMYGDVLYRRL